MYSPKLAFLMLNMLHNIFLLIIFSKCTKQNNMKAFQSNANRPLADGCLSCILNKFEQMWEGDWD